MASDEVCDDGMELNGKYGFCDDDCQGYVAYCGDGIIQSENDEQCDDGDKNGQYGHCATDCSGPGPRCGDGVIQPEHESCDDGAALNGTSASSCTAQCLRPMQ